MAELESEIFYCEKYRPVSGWGEDKYPYRLIGSHSAWKKTHEVEQALCAPGWQWDEPDEDGEGWAKDATGMAVDEDDWSYAAAYPPHRSSVAEKGIEHFVRWRRMVRTQRFVASPETLCVEGGLEGAEAPPCSNFHVDKAEMVGRKITTAVATASFQSDWSDATLASLKKRFLQKLVDGWDGKLVRRLNIREDQRSLDALLKSFADGQKGLLGDIVGLFGGGSEQKLPEKELAVRVRQVEALFPIEERDVYAILAMRRFHSDWVCQAKGNEPYESCPLRPVHCQNPGCQARISAFAQEEHDGACPLKVLDCERCHEQVLRRDMPQHLRALCSERDALCPFAELGCDVQVKHYAMEEHLTAQTLYHVDIMGHALVDQKGAFDKMRAQLVDLDGRIGRQKQTLQRVREAREGSASKLGLDRLLATVEGREAAFEQTADTQLRRLRNDTYYDSKRRADAVQYEVRSQLDAVRREVAKVGGSDLQEIKKDVAHIKTRLP